MKESRARSAGSARPPSDAGWLEKTLMLSVYSFLWWSVTAGNAASWIIGVPAVLAATWATARMGSGSGVRLSLQGLVRFLPFFLWESLRGGIDVARRTIRFRPRVQPGFLHYRTRLDHPTARVFFVNCASLLPGTLAADIEGNEVRIHALSLDSEPTYDLIRLERAVALVFREGRAT